MDSTTPGETYYSISKLFVPRRRAEDSAGARRGEVDKGTDNLEMELFFPVPCGREGDDGLEKFD
jgi:hypothetical protein